jgi:hypothetical protein
LRHYEAWRVRHEVDPLPLAAAKIGLYIADCAEQLKAAGTKRGSVRTIERRLAGISWTAAERGAAAIDRADARLRQVVRGMKRLYWQPPACAASAVGARW